MAEKRKIIFCKEERDRRSLALLQYPKKAGIAIERIGIKNLRKGIYREDLLEMAGRKATPPAVQTVLLLHAHADHADYISFLLLIYEVIR